MPFNWHVYLSETGAETSPSYLFPHVCHSLRQLIHRGETLEAASNVPLDRTGGPQILTWWPAEVLLISGHLVLLKWCSPNEALLCDTTDSDTATRVAGLEVKSGGFWFDLKGSSWHLVRPIWTAFNNGQTWVPPSHLRCLNVGSYVDPSGAWGRTLKERPVSAVFFNQHALYIYEAIKVGGYVECEHEDNPSCVWLAKVLLNVGGRLRLCWFGTHMKGPLDKVCGDKSIFTLFYLHWRIHPLGWSRHYGLSYCPPPGLNADRTISNVDAFIRGAPCAFASLHGPDEGLVNARKIRADHPLFHRDPPLHEFKVGWKLEAVNPTKPYLVQPATVTRIFNSRYFLVELDDLSRPSKRPLDTSKVCDNNRICFVSHAGAPEIMPVNASQLRGLHLSPPPGWSADRPFTWTNYLIQLSSDQRLRGIGTENGLMRTTSHNTLYPANHMQKEDATLNRSELVHIPSSDSLLEDLGSSSSHPTLFCPSEAAFRGVPISDIFSPSGDFESHGTTTVRTKAMLDPAQFKDGALVSCHSQKSCSSRSHTPSCFLLGMKLEMVIPTYYLSDCPSIWTEIGAKLCAATVTRVDEPHLLWLLPDLPESMITHTLKPIMMDARSTDLYPVGWAALVGYPLLVPSGYEDCSVDPQSGVPSNVTAAPVWDVPLRPTHDLQLRTITYNSEEICPPIYVNTKCYLGPFLCRMNLELLPRCFGPGPTSRVMHSMLTRIVSAAYKPIRVLRMFEADWVSGMASALTSLRAARRLTATQREGATVTRVRSNLHTASVNFSHAESEVLEQRRSGMRVVILRVRCPRRGVKVEAPVEVCCRTRAVEEFCRQVSLVLEACPHLISPNPLTEDSSDVNSSSGFTSALPFVQPSVSQRKVSDYCAIDTLRPIASETECPSFCVSRLRSRNLDRLPGWKRRMFASLRPFGFEPPSSDTSNQSVTRRSTGLSSNGLRTRSAVAAERQLCTSDRSVSPVQNFPAVLNGTQSDRTTKRAGNRVSKRFRQSSTHQVLRQKMGHSEGDDSVTENCSTPDSYKVDSKSDSYPVGMYLNHQFEDDCHTQEGQFHHLHIHTNAPWHNNRFSLVCSNVHTSARFRSNRHPIFAQDWHSQDNGSGTCYRYLLPDAPRVTLSSNPLFWSPVDLASYLGETDCREMWPWLAAEAVDGQAFMLLTLPVLHHLVGLRWEDAVRLARQVASVKRAFIEQFGGATLEERSACTQSR